MKYGSLFAGIGGIDLGLERAGMECTWQVEIDPFCQKVLQKHWPNIKRYSDVREVGKHNLEPVDLVAGGFPCQDVSLAGLRKGLEGKRSTLWSEFFRIVCDLQPRWVLAENVPGLLSSDNGEFIRVILRDLASISFDAEWNVLPAAVFGAPHIRERVFIIAYPKNDDGECRRPLIPTSAITRDLAININPFSKTDWNGTWIDRKDESSYIRNFPEPIFYRMDDGVPNRVERLRATGNAVVPQVAEWIGRRIMEANQCK